MSHSFETANLKQAIRSDLMHHIVYVVCVDIQLTHLWILLSDPVPLKHGLLGHIVLIRCLLDRICHFRFLPLLTDLVCFLPSLLLNQFHVCDSGDELAERLHGLLESRTGLQLWVDEFQDIEVDFLVHLEGSADGMEFVCQISHVLLRDKLVNIKVFEDLEIFMLKFLKFAYDWIFLELKRHFINTFLRCWQQLIVYIR
jgi:hypothetical protein